MWRWCEQGSWHGSREHPVQTGTQVCHTQEGGSHCLELTNIRSACITSTDMWQGMCVIWSQMGSQANVLSSLCIPKQLGPSVQRTCSMQPDADLA